MSDELLNATLVSRTDLNPELAVFRVRPNSGPAPEFEPGQFIMIGLPPDPSEEPRGDAEGGDPKKPKLIKRAMSIASPATQRDSLNFYIVLITDGQLTPKLWKVPEGGKLWMDTAPKGKFTLKDVPPDKDLVMVGTGTGLAPYISMLHTYRNAPNRWRRFVIIHGVRYAPDLGYRAELKQMAKEDPRLVYIPLVTREPENSDYKGMRGRIYKAFEGDAYEKIVGAPLDPEQCHVFLCGNPDMVKTMKSNLLERGFKMPANKVPGNIHIEQYW